jgi:hypothetical protein
MEISEKELLRDVREVDDMHREGMETMADDIAELHSGEGRSLMDASRRRLLKKAGIGGVLTIGAVTIPLVSLMTAAYAQTASSSDLGIAAFAESVELAAVAAYTAAAQTGKITGAVLTIAETFAMHHKAHAAAFGSFAGDASKAVANPGLVAAIGPQIKAAASETALLQIAYGLENAAASTYLFAIGALESPAALKLTASILPVESQHATVLGHALGEPLGDTGTFIPAFLNTSAALSPTKYPIQPGT